MDTQISIGNSIPATEALQSRYYLKNTCSVDQYGFFCQWADVPETVEGANEFAEAATQATQQLDGMLLHVYVRTEYIKTLGDLRQ